ncbi:BTAD domain-containing putative transcriptional regulator [Nocardioides pelophilus]|uniref:BTAD domain-containing putative transcriptional regulator n=1 Tax=Nocardioides pelophilus TaxID=2172019 RepID=UPI0016008C3B|nr:BTAD domain-containing putative transcriptional regulator [Nocardioides pelophilus]
MDVRFRLLGPMEILVEGCPVGMPGAAERAVLVQLLLSPGRTIPATMLVDRLWSESSLPQDPMNALQIRVSKLRRSLKAVGVPEVVTREGVGYRANVDPRSVDAVDFVARVREARARSEAAVDGADAASLDAYDEALALWQGDALADFAAEQWAMVEAARFSKLRLAALTERAQVALALGRHAEVVADLDPLVAHDPTLESLTGLLMVALYRSGRQTEALEAYRRTRDVLDESLGLEPSLTLRSLHERVLRQDEALGSLPDLTPASVAVSRVVPAEKVGTAPTNLPTVVRPLIGRDAQLDSLGELVLGTRLLTLIGPGGAGKTSLALAAVVRTSEAFPDGAFGVRLASVDMPDEVPLAVADALGVPLDGAAGDRDVRERVVSYLVRRRLLLLVDNCEHVIDAAAGLIDQILSRCPDVTILATSREALAIPDEVQVTVGPLGTPPDGTPAGDVLLYPAAQLFVERARSVRPGTVFGDEDLAAIGRITRALDGIPLALELAGVRVATMSPVEIAGRLDQRFALLTTGARTAEARQQTLRATVDWSYALLTEREQTVFNRLAVFQGGWSLSASEAVVTDPALATGEVLDTLGRLVERSMVVVDRGASTRYRMLDTLRHYAAEQLVASGEHEAVAQRHAEHFRDVVHDAESRLRGHDQRETFQRLRDEQPNIRAALAWLGRPGGDLDSALETAGALGLFWHLGRHLEGREVLSRLLESGEGSPSSRARALQAVSLVERPRACLVHPSPRCAETARESLAIFDALGDGSRAALSRVLLAVEGVTGQDPDQAEDLLCKAEAQFAADGDAWGGGVVGFVRMETALKNGNETAAVPIGRATSATFRHLDDPWGLSAILYHLGWGLRQFGRYDEGSRALEEAIDVAAGAGLYNTVQWALADLAIAQLHLGDQEAARSLLDRASAASEHVGDGAGAVLACYGHGLVAQVGQEWGLARERYAESYAGFGALGTPVSQGLALAGLARWDEAAGDATAAGRRYDELLELSRRIGEPGLTSTALEGLCRLASARGDRDLAAGLLAEASRLRISSSRPRPPHEERDLAAAVADLTPDSVAGV